MWDFNEFGFIIENSHFCSFLLKISSLRNKTCLWRVKLIFKVYLCHYELQSGFSTLDPIVAERETLISRSFAKNKKTTVLLMKRGFQICKNLLAIPSASRITVD